MSEKQKGKMTVLVTQCIVCAVVLLLGLLIRVLGGGWAAEAKTGLFAALADNTFADVLFDPPQTTTAPQTTATTAPPTSARAVEDKRLVAAAATTAADEPVLEQRATEFPSPVCLPLANGVLTSGFGEREHPITGERSTHTGWDIAADEGTPLFAMYDGVVCETGSGGSYGNYLEMQVTEDFSVIYAHCQTVFVNTEDAVYAGQMVALVGSTGVSTGNHLHLEFLQKNTPMNPALVLPLSLYAG